MSEPRRSPGHGRLLAAVAVIVAVALILAPEVDESYQEANPTTFSTGPFGARGLYELMERLGWPVERRMEPFREELRTDATYIILDPPIPPGARETGRLLAAVRGGARLIVVPAQRTSLADSLGVAASRNYAFGAEAEAAPGAPEMLDREVLMERWLVPAGGDTLLPPRLRPLLLVHGARELRPAVAALPVGDGQVLLLADVGFLRNARLRAGDEAVLAVRLVEWLETPAAATREPLVFSEWHHGHGVHPSAMRVIATALLGTGPGRAVLLLVLAGGIWLLAVGVRPVAPEPVRMIERRSPFEHVGALSQAYRQVGATRLATRHLVRGLWRRRSRGVRAPHDERQYLLSLRERHPQLAGEVDTLVRALEHRVPPADFVNVGAAVHTIERTLTQ